MKKVIVTGASGFLGRQTLGPLVERGFEVHAVSRDVPKKMSEQIYYHACDILDEQSTEKLFKEIAPTHLIHCAWYVEPGKFWTAVENLSWVAASIRMFESFARHGGKRAVFAGTCAEYDWSHDFLSENKTPLHPSTLYGICKDSLHKMLEKASVPMGVSLAWGRLFFLYGPHEAPRRLVSEIISGLLQGKSVPCTEGHQKRDFMHIEDAGRAFVEVLESAHEGAVNIASGQNVSIGELAQEIGKLIGRSELLKFGAYPTPPNDPMRLGADTRILHEKVGFKPRYDLQSGLKQTIDWWREDLAKRG